MLKVLFSVLFSKKLYPFAGIAAIIGFHNSYKLASKCLELLLHIPKVNLFSVLVILLNPRHLLETVRILLLTLSSPAIRKHIKSSHP